MRSYKALLRGDHLEWIGVSAASAPLNVDVTIFEDAPAAGESRRQEMAKILEKLSALGSFSDVTDPVAWQRELRQDQALPGRDK